MELGEGQILELVLHPVDTDALGQRRIDIHRLARDAPALLRILDEAERAHVVEAIRELDQEDADILGHGEDELAEILRLLGLVRLQLDARELGDAIDEPRDIVAEEAIDILERGHRILDRVVQEAGHDRRTVELHLGQNARDFDRMREIGIAGGPHLRAMRLHREDIGAVDRVLVGIGVVGADTLDELELPHHGRVSVTYR